jgi:hypothetical protein
MAVEVPFAGLSFADTPRRRRSTRLSPRTSGAGSRGGKPPSGPRLASSRRSFAAISPAVFSASGSPAVSAQAVARAFSSRSPAKDAKRARFIFGAMVDGTEEWSMPLRQRHRAVGRDDRGRCRGRDTARARCEHVPRPQRESRGLRGRSCARRLPCCPDTRRPTGSGWVVAASRRRREPTASSSSRRLSSSIVWRTLSRRRGSTGTAITGCFRRITS